MKRLFALMLALSLALTACAPNTPNPVDQSVLAPGQVAQAILSACGEVETEAVTGDDLTLWLTEFYGLPEHSWDDAVLYRASNPMFAFEIAVIRLSADANGTEVLSLLENYRMARQGDFHGYDPKQAALVENSQAVLSAGENYAALLICQDQDAAGDAFYEALGQNASPPMNTPAPKPTPSTTPMPTPTPTPPPIRHMMEIYDTSAIIEAWNIGNDSALSDYDRTILARCRDILDSILHPDMSDLEKEQAIYQWIVHHVAYDFDHYDLLKGASPDSSTPYNPLVSGKGICMGFASTFQLLADLSGLESIIVPGTAYSGKEDHAWNMVRLNGNWYCVDSTWDTGIQNPKSWHFFNVTSEYMYNTDHQWHYADFPEATATDRGIS